MAGCIPAPRHLKKSPPVPEKNLLVIHTGAGSADIYSEGKNRLLQYTVSWQNLGLGVSASKGARAGRMLGVKAKIYSGPNTGSTATSDAGQGDKADQELVLEGNVVVTSRDGKSVLNCEKLRYVGPKKRFFAYGNVRFRNSVGSIGTFSQLIASADLKKAATPGDFDR